MDKYLSDRSVCDFIVAEAGYFQSGLDIGFTPEKRIEQNVVDDINAQGGIEQVGKIYGDTGSNFEFITEDYYRKLNGSFYDEDTLNQMVDEAERDADGKLVEEVQLYGMDSTALSKMTVLEGDLSEVGKPGSRKIAAVYAVDDYGNAMMDTNWAKIGDTVTVRHNRELEYYDPETGEVYENEDAIGDQPYRTRAIRYEDIDYEVAALVSVPITLSYRYFGSDEFILNDQTFMQDTGTSDLMVYFFDTTDEANPQMEQFLQDYTENVNPSYDFESKASYEAEFNGFRNMFLLMGGVLSLVIAVVGILNFINAILTGIITRKRELAMLQSIGMTGRQLKTMLVEEGLLYALGSILLALVLSLGLQPLVGKVLSNMFWFFSFHFTWLPIALVAPIFALFGCIVPMIVYHSVAKQTIVERLRESET